MTFFGHTHVKPSLHVLHFMILYHYAPNTILQFVIYLHYITWLSLY